MTRRRPWRRVEVSAPEAIVVSFDPNEKFYPFTLNLLRIVSGFMIAQHGAQKLFGVLGAQARPLFSLSGFGGVLELVGGFAILIGLFVRPAAFVLSGMMATAYWMVHGTQSFWPIVNQGEKAALYCFVFLTLWGLGGGDFSIEGWLKRRR